MIRRLLVIIGVILPIMALGAVSSMKKPDFAYPKTVAADAEARLEKAISTADGPATLRALMDIYLALTRINPDSAQAAIQRIAAVSHDTQDMALRSMILTFEADIYANLYNASPWVYNSRTLPPEPRPARISEWSGDQFRARINELTDSAMLYSDAAAQVQLKAYASCITTLESAPRQTFIYYPTVMHFVAGKCISILTSVGHINSLLPITYLSAADSYLTMPVPTYDATCARVLDIYATLMRSTARGSAPWAVTELGRINFMAEHVYEPSRFRDSRPEDSDTETAQSRRDLLLRELYEQNQDSEYSLDLLLALFMSHTSVITDKWLYEQAALGLKKHPAYWRRNCLQNERRDLERKSLLVEIPAIAAPGTPVKLKCELRNVTNGEVRIFNVSSAYSYQDGYSCVGTPKSAPVATVKLNASGTVPFTEEVTKEVTFPSIGAYVAIPFVDGQSYTGRRHPGIIHVTDYVMATSRFENFEVWALTASDGAPVPGAKITRWDGRKSTAVGTTGPDGSIQLDKGGSFTMQVGADRYAESIWGWFSPRKAVIEWTSAYTAFTSLPLYHPGDTVDFVALAYEYLGAKARVLSGKEITVNLRDANSMEIDTLRLTTDRFGRAEGRFAIPEDCLQGRFTVMVEGGVCKDFTVSDYKLPTFRVITEAAEQDTPAAGAVTLRGKAETYAGFPLAEAQIDVKLSVASRWSWWLRRSSAPVSYYSCKAVTNEYGKYEIVIPADVIATAPIPDGIFVADITVTSSTGESHEASTVFSTGTKYSISAEMPAAVDAARPVKDIKAKVVDYRDSTVTIPVNLQIRKGDTLVMDLPVKPELDLAAIPSGRYTFRFSLADSTLADAVEREAVVYKPTDTATPVPGTLLWSPQSRLEASTEGHAEWLYAVDCPTHLNVSLTTGTQMLSRSWVEVPEGMGRLPIELPEGIDEATLTVVCTGRYRSATLSATIERKHLSPAIRFTAESFRDRVNPGHEETWTFRVIDQSDQGTEAAVIADMYNTALDAIISSSWALHRQDNTPSYFLDWNLTSYGNRYETFSPQNGKRLSCQSLPAPRFETYGLGFISSNGLRIRGYNSVAMMKAAPMALSDATEEVEEEAASDAMDYDSVEEVMTTGYVTGLADAGSGVLKENAVVTEGSSASEPQKKDEDFQYRDGEVPLAFFRPMLTTDADGRLSLSFTVPDANTTWGFRAIAFTDSLLSTSFASDVIASKPIMVQPNLPRFVRIGDRTDLLASVMNASDSVQTVTTVAELFDPATGRVISSAESTDAIAPGRNAVVSLTLETTSGAPFVGYRVRSATSVFADGEQSLIPILPAVTPVIETYPFYIAPSSDKFEMELPKVPAGAQMTLQYCDNATWYVVTALPGLLDFEASTAVGAATSIFSAAIATGLLDSNPAIASALREWTASDHTDATLTSMLSRNQELKQLLLSATPWMLDAKRDTERMTRLALLFDETTVKSALKANIAMLRKLTRGTGGWTWYQTGTEASEWATETALLLFGQLNELGFLPKDKELREMIVNAISWIDGVTLKNYRKYPDGDYSRYLFMRQRFGGIAPKPDAGLTQSVCTMILKNWKNSSVADKTTYAQILARNGYMGVARELVSSLRQYSEYSPAKGMYFPSVYTDRASATQALMATALAIDAFRMIEPGSVDIDRMRQWLILQKESQSWGSSVETSWIISSVLASSPAWVSPSGKTEIKVGGKDVRPTETERLTGYIKAPIELKAGSQPKLTVKREGDTPAWGAVHCLYTDSMTEVKAKGCPEITIQKEVVMINDDLKPEFADTLSLGQRVRVTLTLRVETTMDYVTIVDDRPACYEPVEQLPQPIVNDGIWFYRENRDASTRFFIDRLPKGSYVLTYDMWVNNAGSFASGIATVQSQYAPQFTAHSSGSRVEVTP